MRGRIIINFEYDEESKCNWDIKQDGTDKLDNENLVYLFQHIIGEIITDK
jgi:hypothetical protein